MLLDREATVGPVPDPDIVRTLVSRTPFAYEGLFGHLAASAVPGVEEVRDGAFRRALEELERLVERGDPDALEAALGRIKAARDAVA